MGRGFHVPYVGNILLRASYIWRGPRYHVHMEQLMIEQVVPLLRIIAAELLVVIITLTLVGIKIK